MLKRIIFPEYLFKGGNLGCQYNLIKNQLGLPCGSSDLHINTYCGSKREGIRKIQGKLAELVTHLANKH